MHSSVLVTGGTGFLGSHLCQQLLMQNCQVYCLDNFYTGTETNVDRLQNHPHFELIQQDVCLPIDVEVNAIFHLACPASPIHYQKNPIQTTRTSVLGALNVLELAKKLGARVLFTSTSEIYGDPTEHPQKESYWGNVNSIGPRACYDEGKRCAESLFMDYHRQYGLDIRIARIFNTYGPYMCANDGRVVSNFIVQALRGDPLTIYGDGTQTRSFCYVDDLVKGLQLLMSKPNLTTPINLGNPIEKTMTEIAEKILQLTSSPSAITYHPLPQDDPKQRCPDITKAKMHLGWEPVIDLETGLKKTIDYFKKILL